MSSIIKGLTSEQEVTKNQPEVAVPGYGTMPLDMLKRHVQSLSKEFNDSIQKGEFLKAAYRTEQFYNALMALAKALKQQGVSETTSTGTTAGSAGIGGGAGLGIDKSPMEKVLEKPLGETTRPFKAAFNPKPKQKGSGHSPDDYEYTDYVPRGKEDKEAWAIQKTVAKQKLPPKKPKELNTGFYKSYLNNRPVREEDLEEANPNQQMALYDPSGTTYKGQPMPKMEPDPADKAKPLSRARNVPADLPDPDDEIRQKQLKNKLNDIIDNDPGFSDKERFLIKAYWLDGKTFDQLAKEMNLRTSLVNQIVRRAERKLRHPERAKHLKPFLLADGQIYSAGVAEEQAPMFTPEEKIVNMNDPRSDGWRVYKAKPAGTKESSIMKGIQSEGK